MKKVLRTLAAGSFLVSSAFAMDKAVVPLKDINFKFGVQHRVMYNYSNAGSKNNYDFFRQRLRVNFDVSLEEGVGTYFQVEYRGGWGGSSPQYDDPRATYKVNALNRLKARGLRYGYLYAPVGGGTLLAGLIPANDEVNQMLFSADWDLHVGGIAYTGNFGGINIRAGYLRLVEGVFYRNTNVKDQDENFVILDLDKKVDRYSFGAHWYGAYGNIINDPDNPVNADNDENKTKLNQTWLALTAETDIGMAKLNGVFIYNTGKQGNTSNDGFLIRFEANAEAGPGNLGLLGIYSSGDKNGTGFISTHEIIGTQGYWQYGWIFAPADGPSDVNDLFLRPGNKGYGLTTLQTKYDIGLTERLRAILDVAWYQSSKAMPLPLKGGTSKDLGTEIGGMLKIALGKHMGLDVGYAYLSLGDAGKEQYNNNADSFVQMLFSRMQIEF